MNEHLLNVVEANTRRWLEKAVIGLNLCPFAKSVYSKSLVHLAVSAAETAQGLLSDLQKELLALSELPETQRETTVLIAPFVLSDFLDYNDFLGEAESLLVDLHLEGEIQIASFHPEYQFAGTSPSDIENFTNRSPYPILHLLRETSIERAVENEEEAQAIYGRNIETLKALGPSGWAALKVGPNT